ncbi:MAG: glycosyltransferase [Thermoanaerobaculum sp.]
MIPVYNCAHYLEAALRSVLAQDPGPEAMQIAVVDDLSNDDPEAIIKNLAPGRVEYVRHTTRHGAAANFNACIRLARGRWVHILHGDDAVRPGFYETMQQAISMHPEIVAAFCRTIFVNSSGHWLGVSDLDQEKADIYANFLARIAISNRVWAPAIVVKREVYEKVGGFNPDLPHCCDWDMWKRVALAGPVWFTPDPLVLYRVHPASDTSKLVQNAANIADMRKALALSLQYLPANEGPRWVKVGRRKVAEIALVSMRELLEKRQTKAAWRHFVEALKVFPHPATLANGLLTLAAFLVRRLIPASHTMTGDMEEKLAKLTRG